MSSRTDAKKWMKFCKHMREAIIDERKAVPDYSNLIKQAKKLGHASVVGEVETVVREIIEDEKRHRQELTPLLNQFCPKKKG